MTCYLSCFSCRVAVLTTILFHLRNTAAVMKSQPLHTDSMGDAEVIINRDNEALRALGYEPILRRSWSGFAALCIVLSSMSVLTSVVGTHRQISG
jgi:hypothetical protein